MDLRSRLLRGAEVSGDCLIFGGYRDRKGYGQIWSDGRLQYAHRVSWELENGPVPDGLVIRHTCDTPGCIRADHLLSGTHADNSQDAVSRGRHRWVEGESAGQARLSDEDVRSIRERYVPRVTTRSLAEEYGVTPQYISQLARRVWRKSA